MKSEYIEKVLSVSQSQDVETAVVLQKELSSYITLQDDYVKSNIIAGVDIAYTRESCFCAIVLMDSSTMKVIEEAFAQTPASFPYIPGLLFYREFPSFYEAYQKLHSQPDILIFDGQGLSHQRMMGIATMAGILLEKPTIGCAKSHLFSDGYKVPENSKFSTSELRVNQMLVGYVLRSKENIKPIFLSTGYRVSPQSALKIIKQLITTYKLPLPTHLAHNACEHFKKSSGEN